MKENTLNGCFEKDWNRTRMKKRKREREKKAFEEKETGIEIDIERMALKEMLRGSYWKKKIERKGI